MAVVVIQGQQCDRPPDIFHINRTSHFSLFSTSIYKNFKIFRKNCKKIRSFYKLCLQMFITFVRLTILNVKTVQQFR